MKKLLISLSICSLTVAVTLSSCKKKNDPTTKDKIVGSWKYHQYSTDINGNGIMDDYINNMDTYQYVYTFSSDGSAVVKQFAATVMQFRWSVNGNYLLFTTDSAGTEAHLITSGPSSTMTLKDTTYGVNVWVVLNKE